MKAVKTNLFCLIQFPKIQRNQQNILGIEDKQNFKLSFILTHLNRNLKTVFTQS